MSMSDARAADAPSMSSTSAALNPLRIVFTVGLPDSAALSCHLESTIPLPTSAGAVARGNALRDTLMQRDGGACTVCGVGRSRADVPRGRGAVRVAIAGAAGH